METDEPDRAPDTDHAADPAAEPPKSALSGAPLFRWRSRLLLTSKPGQVLSGMVPTPYHDVPRRPLLPPDLNDPTLQDGMAEEPPDELDPAPDA